MTPIIQSPSQSQLQTSSDTKEYYTTMTKIQNENNQTNTIKTTPSVIATSSPSSSYSDFESTVLHHLTPILHQQQTSSNKFLSLRLILRLLANELGEIVWEEESRRTISKLVTLLLKAQSKSSSPSSSSSSSPSSSPSTSSSSSSSSCMPIGSIGTRGLTLGRSCLRVSSQLHSSPFNFETPFESIIDGQQYDREPELYVPTWYESIHGVHTNAWMLQLARRQDEIHRGVRRLVKNEVPLPLPMEPRQLLDMHQPHPPATSAVAASATASASTPTAKSARRSTTTSHASSNSTTVTPPITSMSVPVTTTTPTTTMRTTAMSATPTQPVDELYQGVISVLQQSDPNGLNRLLMLSRSLTNFLKLPPGAQMTRARCLRLICDYIESHQLYDPRDRRVIRCDGPMREIFGGEETISYLSLHALLAPHVERVRRAYKKRAKPEQSATSTTTTAATPMTTSNNTVTSTTPTNATTEASNTKGTIPASNVISPDATSNALPSSSALDDPSNMICQLSPQLIEFIRTHTMIEMPNDPIITMRHHTIVEIISLYVTSKQLELSPDVIQLQNEPYLAGLIGIETMHPHEVFTVTVTQLLTAIDAHLLPIPPPSTTTTAAAPNLSAAPVISPADYARLEVMADEFAKKLAAHLEPATIEVHSTPDPTSTSTTSIDPNSQSHSQPSQPVSSSWSSESPRKKQRIESDTIESTTQQTSQSHSQSQTEVDEDEDEMANEEEEEEDQEEQQ